jgi:MYXO-CTERM domain-containing protein
MHQRRHPRFLADIRVVLFLVAGPLTGWIVLFPTAAAANTSHHHIGGGTSGGSPDNADCLRWETVYLSSDGAVVDGPAADGGDADAGDGGDAAAAAADGGAAPAVATLRCMEHATLFGCDCSADGGAGRAGGAWPMATMLAAIAVATAIRRRRPARARAPRS